MRIRFVTPSGQETVAQIGDGEHLEIGTDTGVLLRLTQESKGVLKVELSPPSQDAPRKERVRLVR